MSKRIILTVFCCMFIFVYSNIYAAEEKQTQAVRIADGFNLPEFRIAKGKIESFQTSAWNGKNAAIDFYARIDEKPENFRSGHYGLAVKINDRVVRSRYEGTYMADSWYTRLMNKPFYRTMFDGKRQEEFHWKFYWFIFRSSDFIPYSTKLNALNSEQERGQMYHFVIDVTDFMDSNSANTIVFHHANHEKQIPTKGDIVVKDFKIREFKGSERLIKDNNLERPLGSVAKGVLTDYSKVAHKVQVNNDGTIIVTTGENSYLIESIISYPGQLGNGLVQNKYEITPEKDWSIKLEKNNENEYVITAQGSFYKLIRTLNLKGNGIEVRDRYINTTDKDLGIYIDNFFTTQQKVDVKHLAGVPLALEKAEREENAQTSVLALNANGGLGIIAKDVLNRANSVVYMDGNRFGIKKNAILFAPKAEHVLEWDIVPVEAGGDYFDFINVVRNNWNIIFEVPAVLLTPRVDKEPETFAWIDGIDRKPPQLAQMSIEEIRNYLRNMGGDGIKYVLFSGYKRDPQVTKKLEEKYGKYTLTVQGADCFNSKEYFEFTKGLVKKLKLADPNAKAIGFFCIYINTEDPEVIKANYPDSIMFTKQREIVPYAKNLYNMHIAIGNSYAKTLDKVFDYYYNDIGFDGIYFDVSCHAKPQYDYSRWDGASGELTKDYRIDCKKDDSAISSDAFKIEMYRKMIAQGKCLWANIETTSLMAGVRFPQQVESPIWDYLYRSHVFCPVAYNEYRNSGYIEDLARNTRMCVRLGALNVQDRIYNTMPNHPTSFSKMYPMTPKELQEGYIIGPDKIITIRKGKFGWKENECKNIKAFVFDKHEKPVERKINLVSEDGYRLIDIDLQPGDLAVLERKK